MRLAAGLRFQCGRQLELQLFHSHRFQRGLRAYAGLIREWFFVISIQNQRLFSLLFHSTVIVVKYSLDKSDHLRPHIY